MKVVNKKWIFDHLNSSINTNSNVSVTVKKIIEDVKKNKDRALLKYVKKFENKKANLKSIIIPQKTLKEAYNSLSNESKKSLKLAYKRIFYYHSKQKKYHILSKISSTRSFTLNGNQLKMLVYIFLVG